MNTEVQMENIENEVQIEEIEPSVEMDVQDNSASPVETPDEIPVESTGAAELEEIESTEIIEATVLSDPEDAEALNGSESTIAVIDYTEALVLVHDDLVHMNQSLDIVVIIMLVWFGSWVLRSWRTWMVKGGK